MTARRAPDGLRRADVDSALQSPRSLSQTPSSPRGARMQFLEIGLDHATADVTVRERLAVSSADLPTVLADLRQLAADVLVISTCNRVELYLLAADADAASHAVVSYLAARSGLDAGSVRAATR